jgi:prepilin-type N-terminal cleavage/methylation domain-containing protein
MTFSKLKTMKKDRGFTIVELLIVIVVIAILAAIVIVAYSGIQNKARDSTDSANAESIVKVAEAENNDNGAYPTGASSAALTTSFNSGTTSKLPAGVAITLWATSDPTESAAETLANASPKNYTVKVCTGGVTVMYPSRALNALQKMNAGSGC